VRTPVARAGIAVAAVVAIVGLFLIASGSDDATDSTTQPPVAQDATGGQSQAARPIARKQPKKRAAPPAPVVERIVVRGGRPVGGVKRLEYKRGQRVRFSVRSNVADEVHVHGFDIEKAVPANRPVRFAFPADIEGVFEVELHSSHTKIVELRVGP
jgi:hypothetical protein